MVRTNPDRRALLRTAAASTVGASALTGSALADDQQDCWNTDDISDGCEGPSAPCDYPYLYDHDDDGTDERFGDWPTDPNELVFFVHGYQSSSTQNGVDHGYAADLAAEHNGYTEPFVAVCWASDTTVVDGEEPRRGGGSAARAVPPRLRLGRRRTRRRSRGAYRRFAVQPSDGSPTAVGIRPPCGG